AMSMNVPAVSDQARAASDDVRLVSADAPTAPQGTPATAAPVPARSFRVDITLRSDALTCIMLTMVTFISSLVAIFAAGYMHGDRGYWRFFTYIGLFVFSMTMLVSVSNFVLLFVFWEAVGVCSYLLIGFWYHKPEAAAAGKKAFLVNRVGDFGFALALFLIWTTYGTLDFHDTPAPGAAASASASGAATSSVVAADGAAIREFTARDSGTTAVATIVSDAPHAPAAASTSAQPTAGTRGVLSVSRARANDYRGGYVALAICLLLMLGACGKSAQFPLHVWLPDAMEGPTPVSALIHAATMVTAGVYMVTRCTPLFVASPEAQLAVSVIGGFTALLAGLIALTQYDLKRVLAYSTVSQLGYMFLGLGTGSLAGITAGMFHLYTHAFFKALLFLGSGSVMHAMGHVIDMRRFSGLRKLMPITHATFFVGCLALAGVPPLSGFWSKDAILGAVHDKVHALAHDGAAEHGSPSDAAGHAAAATTHLVSATTAATVYEVLYYTGLFVAFLTAFYTFRAYFMTFFGPLRVPREAGDHAHESPSAMFWPLVILAVCAALVGVYFEITHEFANFLGTTPSLATGAITSTVAPGTFHMSVAGASVVVAGAGILLAVYLYLGGQGEVRVLARLFDFEDLSRWLDMQHVTRWKNIAWVAAANRMATKVGLGWLAALVGYLVMFLALLLSAPLLVGYYVSPYRLSLRKFFWDEIYTLLIVKPLHWAGAILYWLDRWLIDGLVNLCGRVPSLTGSLMRSLQVGLVPFYGLAMVLGALILMAARLLWAAG
ncbi:MAG TPA: proton-conducting transporter membrane subunit, partial [Pirellulaceae bacterium]|nr:proton-conducting transporter membrane subunit [Pirellulaceae bacterium]